MLNTLNINLKTDIKTDRPTTLPITLMSQDKNNNQFILRFTNGGEPVNLDNNYTVEVLTKFSKSGASRLTSATVRQDYATWEFDTAYITQDEAVYNFVYVRKSGSLIVSADANCFAFNVDLSEIDKGAGKVAETYDENYQKHLDGFKENVNFEEIAQAEQARKEAEILRGENYEQKVDTAIVEADVVEKVDNKVTELTPKITELTAQLAQTVRQESYNAMSFHTSNSLPPKAYVTFIDDDGSIEVLTRLKPLFTQKGVPCVIAAIANPTALPSIGQKMSFTDMKDLQDNHGWEIASHSVNHYSFINIDADKEKVRYEARESKRILESHGLNISNIVYPNNAVTDFSKGVCSQYYDSGATGGNYVNVKPLNSFGIGRIGLGSYYAAGQGTYEYYKSRVDEAITKKGWAVFMIHIWEGVHDDTQQQHLSDLIDYCLANNVGIVTIRDGLKVFGNRFEVEGKLSITNQGELIEHNPKPIYKVKRDETIVHDSPITAFEKGTITHTTITSGKQQSLPIYGSLVTFRTHNLDDNYSYQTLYSSHPSFHRIYHRTWSNGAWGTFRDLVPKGRTVTVPDIVVGIVNAGKTKTVSVPVGILLAGEPFTLNINMQFDEVIYSYYASSSSVKVTFYNTHTAPLDVGTRTAIIHLPTQET